MADMSNKQDIEGGAIVDALSKMLFKGIGSIFEAAAEYQKEMGVLKSVNKVPVIDTKGQEHELIVKLSPIKDKDGVYFVEVECPGYSKFNAEGVTERAFQINKNNMNDFKKVIDQILKKNKLKRTDGESSSSDDIDADFAITYYADFYDRDTDDPVDIAVTIQVSKEENEIRVKAAGDPRLKSPFFHAYALDNADATIGKKLNTHLEKDCNITVSSDISKEWLKLIELLNEVYEYADDIKSLESAFSKIRLKATNKNVRNQTKSEQQEAEPEQEETAASIEVTLEKVVADGHESINLVSIDACTCTKRQAMHAIQDIVASDEFVDSMPEGTSSYRIEDSEQDYDIVRI